MRTERGDGWGVGSGLVGLYLVSMLLGQLFTVSRNWLAVGEAVLRGPARPQMSEHAIEKPGDVVDTGGFHRPAPLNFCPHLPVLPEMGSLSTGAPGT